MDKLEHVLSPYLDSHRMLNSSSLSEQGNSPSEMQGHLKKIYNCVQEALESQNSFWAFSQQKVLEEITSTPQSSDVIIINEVNRVLSFGRLTKPQRQAIDEINSKKLKLSFLTLSSEDLDTIAPFLTYVNLKGEPFKSWKPEELESFIQRCSHVEFLAIDSDTLEKFNLAASSFLVEFDCEGCTRLQYLDLSNNYSLERCNCRNCPKLYQFASENCPYLKELQFSGNPSLAELFCEECTRLERIDFLGKTSLDHIDCGSCISLRQINLSRSRALKNLFVLSCPELKDLPETRSDARVLTDLDSQEITIPISTLDTLYSAPEEVLGRFKAWFEKNNHFPRIAFEDDNGETFRLSRAYLVSTLFKTILSGFSSNSKDKQKLKLFSDLSLWEITGRLIGFSLKNGYSIGSSSTLFDALFPAISRSIATNHQIPQEELIELVRCKLSKEEEPLANKLAEVAVLLAKGMTAVPGPFKPNLRLDSFKGVCDSKTILSKLKFTRSATEGLGRNGAFPKNPSLDREGSLSPTLLKKWVEERATAEELERFIKAVTGQNGLSLDGRDDEIEMVYNLGKASDTIPKADPIERRILLPAYESEGSFEQTLNKFSGIMAEFLSQPHLGAVKLELDRA